MQVYAVGGAIRDELLGLPVQDRDWVVVGATPAEMLMRGFEQVGAAFPVFLHPRTGEEYALARTERKTGVGYVGFEVNTENVTIEDDLFRRDLTINAIAKDKDGNLIDPFGGVNDLRNKILRHVSEAFAEDPLRVIRLARFYARYIDFNIAIDTVALAQRVVLSGEMDTISAERYWAEFAKVMHSPKNDPARFFSALQLFGVFNHVQFFKDLFGNKPTSMIVAAHAGEVAATAIKLFDEETALVVTVACAAKKSAVFHGTSRRVIAAHAGVTAVLQHPVHAGAAETLELLSTLRAVSKSSEVFKDVVKAFTLLEKMGFKLTTTSQMLKDWAEASQKVSAAPFLDLNLSGRDMGLVMMAARINALSDVLYRRK